MISFIPSNPELNGSIKEYWIWKDIESDKLPWILPSYEIELVVHLGSPIQIKPQDKEIIELNSIHWVGPQTRRWQIPPNQNLNLLSIRFHPGAVYEIFGLEIQDMVNGFPGVEGNLLDFLKEVRKVWIDKNSSTNQDIIDLANILDQYFLHQRTDKYTIPNYLKFAISEMNHGSIKINDLAVKLGISRKQLERKFKQVYGISPKDYRRIHRHLESIRNPNYYKGKKYLQLLQDYSYTDQSHLIHDFKRGSGMKPSDWFSDYDKMSLFYNTKDSK